MLEQRVLLTLKNKRACLNVWKLRSLWRSSVRCFCSEKDDDKIPAAGQYRSTWKILKEEFKGIKEGNLNSMQSEIPRETDFLVIGGGIIGSAIAYWLKQKNPKGFSLTVVERDPVYTRASSMLSAGGIRHQFSIPENVQLSMFTTEFLRNIKEHLSVLDEDPPDVQFNHQGYLFLSRPEEAESTMRRVKMQRELGAKIELLTKKRLSQKFPWLNLEGIECGSYGLEGEGWFDPWSLVRAFKQKNISLGVEYVKGEVIGFDFREMNGIYEGKPTTRKELQSAIIKDEKNKVHSTNFAACFNCAGPWAAEISEMAGIGIGRKELSVALPVEPRKRYVYVVHCPNGPGLEAPFTVNHNNVYFRREGFGGYYICGVCPERNEEPDISSLDVDYDFFHEKVWPSLASRVPAFEQLKMRSGWAGFYEYNTVDQNLVFGQHPYHKNFFFANGLSGHGVQQAAAIGRAMMEYVLDGDFKTIDLSRFSFDRFLYDETIIEESVV